MIPNTPKADRSHIEVMANESKADRSRAGVFSRSLVREMREVWKIAGQVVALHSPARYPKRRVSRLPCACALFSLLRIQSVHAHASAPFSLTRHPLPPKAVSSVNTVEFRGVLVAEYARE